MKKKDLEGFLTIFAERNSIEYEKMYLHSRDVRKDSVILIYRAVYCKNLWYNSLTDTEVTATIYLNNDKILKEINVDLPFVNWSYNPKEVKQMLLEYKLRNK